MNVFIRKNTEELCKKLESMGCLVDNNEEFKYDTVRGNYKQCIPYEGNEHLLGKTDDCNDFYKIWK